ncbi:MAG: methyltransferase domain-containing protein [Stenomitos rutilans HA7619-LM2]|jgi:chemotaxis protein methyltransferase WspC|nr:methyltransferase domain-containing protein [Stenomitos rutilans HA7619-LM2]
MTLEPITALLSKCIGVDAKILGDRALGRAVERRRMACGASDLEAYLTLLQTVPSEFDALVEQIVIPETWFFRDRKPFDFLVDFVRSEWLLKPGTTRLQVLSVPCATGEEPYSIAIALLEAGLAANRFDIDAIDLSHISIAKAQNAIYGKHSFRGKEWIEQHRYFQPIESKYIVCSKVRDAVNFQQGNLLEIFANSSLQYDIIFCRNLLIYIEPLACHQILNTLHRLLAPEGLLFVGASEMGKIPSDRFLYLRQPFTFAYRKMDSVSLRRCTTRLERPKHETALQSAFLASQSGIFSAARSPQLTIASTATPRSSIPSTINAASPSEFQKAKAFADAGHLEAAIDCCKAYLEHHSTNADAYALLGTLYEATARYEQGERSFQKALYLQPKHDEALMHLALLKESRGDAIGAARLRQRMQKLQ